MFGIIHHFCSSPTRPGLMGVIYYWANPLSEDFRGFNCRGNIISCRLLSSGVIYGSFLPARSTLFHSVIRMLDAQGLVVGSDYTSTNQLSPLLPETTVSNFLSHLTQTVQCSAVQLVQCSAVQCRVVQCSAMRALQCKTR